MAGPPIPPADLDQRQPLLCSTAGKWYRVTSKEFHDQPIFFGASSNGRFDSKSAQHGVCYFGKTPHDAFAETLIRLLANQRELRLSEVRGLELHEFRFSGRASAIDLTGEGLHRLGADLECFTGSSNRGYKHSQRWARKLMLHPAKAAGLHYYGRKAGGSCLALFGEKNQADVSATIARKLRIKATACLPLLESKRFLEWLQEGGYVLRKC